MVTPKRDQSQIRLNVGMRVANQAIPRRQTQYPTIDEVVNELSGLTVGVLTFGYVQGIPPTRAQGKFEKCNHLLLLHVGLYRYKRLNYGTWSATEIFKETIREELTQVFKDVFNINDDITKEHDVTWKLKRSREKNVRHVQQRKMRIQRRTRGVLRLDVL